ncbi:hypothetical protein ENH_00002180, partial [Eimeria necatrix]
CVEGRLAFWVLGCEWGALGEKIGMASPSSRCALCGKQAGAAEKGSEFVTMRDVSGAHWARGVEWLCFPATLPFDSSGAFVLEERRPVCGALRVGEWEWEGGLFAVGDLLICCCVGAWKGVRRFGFQEEWGIGFGGEAAGLWCIVSVRIVSWIAVADVSSAHWARELEWRRFPDAFAEWGIGFGEEVAGLWCLAGVSVVRWIAVAVRVGAAASRAGLLRMVRGVVTSQLRSVVVLCFVGVRRGTFGCVQDVSGVHWSREVEWLRFEAALPLVGARQAFTAAQLGCVKVRGRVFHILDFSCRVAVFVCVGAAASRAGLLRKVRNLCQSGHVLELVLEWGIGFGGEAAGLWCLADQGGAVEKGSEFVTMRIRAAAGVARQPSQLRSVVVLWFAGVWGGAVGWSGAVEKGSEFVTMRIPAADGVAGASRALDERSGMVELLSRFAVLVASQAFAAAQYGCECAIGFGGEAAGLWCLAGGSAFSRIAVAVRGRVLSVLVFRIGTFGCVQEWGIGFGGEAAGLWCVAGVSVVSWIAFAVRAGVLGLVIFRMGPLGCVQMESCVCIAGVGHRFWRRGGRSVVPGGCERVGHRFWRRGGRSVVPCGLYVLQLLLVGSDLLVRLDGRAYAFMFSAEWEWEGCLFAVGELLICGYADKKLCLYCRSVAYFLVERRPVCGALRV